MRKVAVFCGANLGKNPEYTFLINDLAENLVEHQISLIYGGGKVGLMGKLANQMLKLQGEVIGVIPDFLITREVAHPALTKLHIVASMHERKKLMLDLADGFIM